MCRIHALRPGDLIINEDADPNGVWSREEKIETSREWSGLVISTYGLDDEPTHTRVRLLALNGHLRKVRVVDLIDTIYGEWRVTLFR